MCPDVHIYTLRISFAMSVVKYSYCVCCIVVPLAPNAHIHFGFCRDVCVTDSSSRMNSVACPSLRPENPARPGDIEKDPLVFGTLRFRDPYGVPSTSVSAHTRTKRYRSLPVVASASFRYISFLRKPRRWLSAIDNIFIFILRVH